ncbi:VTT domain-containing protein [Lentilactobacillus buchneri]|uniref:VTT domain-containing protein n=1 Tax=Lentilactobacillus buchneri TaxID=1581 RepID=UPI0002075E5F|nr:VTT domain-containing protein [Lentilactobacillus buchneri]WCJ51503.1 VTT domain-containing protein [Lentilactobacillus sp. Egmn17]AEB73039.1 SNARE associated Golgi protein-like protein [Lentilactobacillus buchneri NRRL B-30929]MCT2883035.1 cytochrome O ubiquinol oxidase [Lentilactobacillus buchneri]MCT2899355.1 cytochrome O ubiquinol oxidase [Lentilactobacillus buchneri]MCT3554733.1 cytochrome O ubiquinol oxidase [Lentilactobacillus buchneri]
MSTLIDFILHIDDHLINIVNTFGNSTYLILFGVIFIETGAVIFPFLPGDSLLFAAAALSANVNYGLSIGLFVIIFLAASIGGDSLNFFFGNKFGEIIPRNRILGKFIKEKDLTKAREFFNKYGAMAIFFGRFIPIIRTLIPFVAATSDFPYKRFIKYNLIACISWVAICCGAGYYFGNIPVVKENFSMVIIGIVAISLIPAVVGYVKTKFASSK